MPEFTGGRWYLAPGDEVRVGKRQFEEGEDEHYEHPVVSDDGSIPGAAVDNDEVMVEYFCPMSGDFFITTRAFDLPPGSPDFGRRHISDPDEWKEVIRTMSALADRPDIFPTTDAELEA